MTNQTCKAAVLTKRHTIEVMDVQMPECGRDGMIIKLEAASICGTDLHLFEEDPAYPSFLVMSSAAAWSKWGRTPRNPCAATPAK